MSRLLLICLLCVGCAARGDDDDSAGDDDDSTEAPFDVQGGSWSFSLVEILADQCGLFGTAQAGADLGTTTIAVTEPGVFVMTDSDGQIFDCAVDAAGLADCVAQEFREVIQDALDAELVRIGGRSADLSAEPITFIASNTDDCEGEDCDIIAGEGGYTFPCTVEWSMTAAP